MNAQEILLRAREVYAQRGTHKVGWPEEGCVCLITACHDGLPKSILDEDDYDGPFRQELNKAYDALQEELGVADFVGLVKFNEEAGDDEVDYLYTRAIARLAP